MNFQSNTGNQNRELTQGLLYFNDQNQLPKDSIQAIKFSFVNQNYFAAVSWDKTARLYVLNNGQINQQSCVSLPDFPLDFIFLENNDLLVSCGDGGLYRVSFANQNQSPQKVYQGQNQALIFQMSYAPDIKMVIALTQQSLWIFNSQNTQNPQKILNFKHSAVCMNLNLCDLIIAFADDKFAILEINCIPKMSDNDFNYLNCPLKSNITTCAVNSKTKIFNLGSSDGRVSRGVYKSQNMRMNQLIQYQSYNVENKNATFIFVGQTEKSQTQQSKSFQITSCGFNPRSDGFFYTTGSNAQHYGK